MERVECIVIGAGVVGLAVAAALAERGVGVVVLEQHDLIGSETSSRNSEVIHAGIYYPAGSLKAQLCVEGKHRLYEYCEQFHIPHRRCGKIIVATDTEQQQPVADYIDKAKANGVADLRWLSAQEVAELEPLVHSVGGVLSPSTGIVDSHAFMLSLQGQLEKHEGWLVLNTPVEHVASQQGLTQVSTREMTLQCDWLINCAGLHAPQLAADLHSNKYPVPAAHYAKGHYYAYSGPQPFARLVYPMAVSGGLGVHVTLDLAGQIKFGPDVQWLDEIDYSFDSSRLGDFIEAIKKYFPTLEAERLQPGYTGIRPKLAAADSGFVDFRIDTPQMHGVAGRVNLLGIESPGLTASLAIAQRVVECVLDGAAA